MLLLVSAHILYNISAIKERLLKVTKTKGAENPIYLIKFDLEYYINNKNLILFKYILQKDKYADPDNRTIPQNPYLYYP